MQSSWLAPFTKLSKQVAERGWKGTVNQLYLIGDIKFGDLKGTDQFNNKYYENLDYPFGQHRWVEFADIHNPDATMIQPEWHGWMHHMFDETPDEMAAIENDKDIISTTSITHASTMTHIGLKNPTDDKPTVDTSQYRKRGYKIGSLHTTGEEEDHYYKQPGHPLAKDDSGRFKDRKEMKEWTPNDV